MQTDRGDSGKSQGYIVKSLQETRREEKMFG